MMLGSIAALPAALSFWVAGPAAPPAVPPGTAALRADFASATIHQRIVIRVSRLPERSPLPSAADTVDWREKKGPKCLPIGAIAAALAARADSVDFVMAGGDVLRARFGDRCPAVDFYRGLYLRPTRDGQVCAGRDSLRARSGGDCQIKQFRRLFPRR